MVWNAIWDHVQTQLQTLLSQTCSILQVQRGWQDHCYHQCESHDDSGKFLIHHLQIQRKTQPQSQDQGTWWLTLATGDQSETGQKSTDNFILATCLYDRNTWIIQPFRHKSSIHSTRPTSQTPPFPLPWHPMSIQGHEKHTLLWGNRIIEVCSAWNQDGHHVHCHLPLPVHAELWPSSLGRGKACLPLLEGDNRLDGNWRTLEMG